MDKMDDLLDEIRSAAASKTLSNIDLINHFINLFEYLTSAEGRTDKNCKTVDHFFIISDEIDFTKIDQAIIDVIGHCDALHDTITAPDVAYNFGSTPEQILTGLLKLKVSYIK